MDVTATRALDKIFKPRSIAVIGASRKKGTLGWQVLHNLILCEFQGKIFPVNPAASVVHSMKCYPGIEAIEDEVDLALLIVPARIVLQVAEACGRKGVGGLVVISAGFKEVGGEGVRREQQLLEIVRRHGMRMIGPNCMGILNTHPEVRMDAVFAETLPRAGHVAFTSQSGAMGAVIIDHADSLGLGFSMFASVGNKADVSGNDLLEYWEHDPETHLILLYLESFGNPRRFTAIARRLTRKKPVLVVKAGRTAEGARAASSHTGALAGADVAVDALLQQCGVLRVTSVEELFHVATAFASQPIPRGPRVGIVTNAGGPGIMAADALIASGLELPPLPESLRESLQPLLPEEASIRNPVDLIGSATAREYSLAVGALARSEAFDALLVICVPTVVHDPTDVYLSVARAAEGSGKPCLGVFMSAEDVRQRAARRDAGCSHFPVYAFPEAAAFALRTMVTYRRLREAPEGRVVTFPVQRKQAEAVIQAVRAQRRRLLTLEESRQVFGAYGIPFASSTWVQNEEEALAAARSLGWPVALKGVGPGLSHKSEVGAVAVGLETEAELLQACQKMRAQVATVPGAKLAGWLVQEMVEGGVETIIGMSHDRAFGPLLMFGLGGVYVEVLKDVAFRIVPVSDLEARGMLRGIRAHPILEGIRGAAAVSLERLQEVLLRVSQLVVEQPSIQELDLNPFMASPDPGRCLAVDGRIRLVDPGR